MMPRADDPSPSESRASRPRWLPRAALALALAVPLAGCGAAGVPHDGRPRAARPPDSPVPATDKDKGPGPGGRAKEAPNTEAYDHIVDNPFLAADRHPLST